MERRNMTPINKPVHTYAILCFIISDQANDYCHQQNMR